MGPSDQGRSYRGGELGIKAIVAKQIWALDFRVGSLADIPLDMASLDHLCSSHHILPVKGMFLQT